VQEIAFSWLLSVYDGEDSSGLQADGLRAREGAWILLHMGDCSMMRVLDFLRAEEGQDIAEYAVMLAVILVIVVGTIRLIGTNATNVFSRVGSSIQ
jgi:Flp pilus assembly pilin Flp